MTERDENNRKLAEWMGWTVIDVPFVPKALKGIFNEDVCLTEAAYRQFYLTYPSASIVKRVPDFYTDESANALLLERIRREFHINVSLRTLVKVCIKFKRTPLGHRGSRWTLLYAEDPDRKTAIVLASLKLIESEGVK